MTTNLVKAFLENIDFDQNNVTLKKELSVLENEANTVVELYFELRRETLKQLDVETDDKETLYTDTIHALKKYRKEFDTIFYLLYDDNDILVDDSVYLSNLYKDSIDAVYALRHTIRKEVTPKKKVKEVFVNGYKVITHNKNYIHAFNDSYSINVQFSIVDDTLKIDTLHVWDKITNRYYRSPRLTSKYMDTVLIIVSRLKDMQLIWRIQYIGFFKFTISIDCRLKEFNITQNNNKRWYYD